MLFLESRGANCWVYLSLPMVWCRLFNRWWCSIILSCNLLLGPARPFLTRPAAPITFLLPLAFPFSPSFLLSTLFLSKLSFLSPINCTWSTCGMMTLNFQITVKLTLEFVSSLVKTAVKAVTAAQLSISSHGIYSVTLDEAIEAMRLTAADMSVKYKETSLSVSVNSSHS